MNVDQTLFGLDLARSEVIMAKVLTKVMRSCPYSREQISDMLSLMLGRKITVHVLNNITSATKPHHADWNLVKGICAITGYAAPLIVILEGLGHQLVEKADVPVFEMHKLMLERKRIDDEMAALEGQISNGSK